MFINVILFLKFDTFQIKKKGTFSLLFPHTMGKRLSKILLKLPYYDISHEAGIDIVQTHKFTILDIGNFTTGAGKFFIFF